MAKTGVEIVWAVEKMRDFSKPGFVNRNAYRVTVTNYDKNRKTMELITKNSEGRGYDSSALSFPIKSLSEAKERTIKAILERM